MKFIKDIFLKLQNKQNVKYRYSFFICPSQEGKKEKYPNHFISNTDYNYSLKHMYKQT